MSNEICVTGYARGFSVCQNGPLQMRHSSKTPNKSTGTQINSAALGELFFTAGNKSSK